MLISFNGKPLVGKGTDDEPPPSAHVLMRMISRRISKVKTTDDGQGYEAHLGIDLSTK